MLTRRLTPFAFAAAFFLTAGFLPLYRSNAESRPPITIVTDPSWEVSARMTYFGEYPLAAEQLASATSALWGGSVPAVAAETSGLSKLVPGSVPIWRNPRAERDAAEGYHFRKNVPLGADPIRKATLEINCDDVARVYINKRLVSVEGRDGTLKDGNDDWFTFRSLSGFTTHRLYTYDVTDYFFTNITNTILVETGSLTFSGSHAYLSARIVIEFDPLPEPPRPAVTATRRKPEPTAAAKPAAEKPVAGKPASAEASSRTVFEAGRDPELEKLRVGSVLELGHVYFNADDYRLDTASYRTLAALASFLKRHPTLRIEVGGHTNLRPNDRFAAELSTNRARSVMRYLTDNGVPPDRVTYRGYGKTRPRVKAVSKEADRANQRVEITVLEK